jgi:Fe2+ or Zn2+ uptake regulation protein
MTPNDAPLSVDHVLDRMAATGGRRTPARRAIVEVLLAGDHHTTAETIADALARTGQVVNVSTVYRTLEALEELGIVDHVHLDHGPTVWHVGSTAHHHLVCVECGRVIEVPLGDLDGLRSDLCSRYGFTLAPHYALTGTCEACAAGERRRRHAH